MPGLEDLRRSATGPTQRVLMARAFWPPPIHVNGINQAFTPAGWTRPIVQHALRMPVGPRPGGGFDSSLRGSSGDDRD